MHLGLHVATQGITINRQGEEWDWLQIAVTRDGNAIGTLEIAVVVLNRQRDGQREISLGVTGSLDSDKILI